MTDWLDVSATAPRIGYTATASQTVFTVPFIFFSTADLLVYQNGVLLTLGTHYTVTGAEDEDGGTVTLVTGATVGDAIMIVRDIEIAQTTHLPPSGPLDIGSINIQFSRQIAIDQQLDDRIDRSVHLGDSDTTSSMEVPALATRKGRLAAFDASTGDLTVTEHTADELDSVITGALTTAGGFGEVNIIGTLGGLKALAPVAGAIVYVQGRSSDGDGGQGIFAWKSGDYSTEVATDTNSGIYAKADSVSASSGCWVRQFDGMNYMSKWFGVTADHTTDNSTIINTIIATSDLPNTLSTAGKQSAAYIHIEGGVRFSSSSLSFLPSGNHVFVYLCYFANSDLTKGIADGGGGTNEHYVLSVNSGYPGDSTGGMVAEWSYSAPLHPAIMLNVAKQVDGADAHFGTGQQRIPDDTGPARAGFYIKDENTLRIRLVYEGWGGPTTYKNTAAFFQPFNQTVSLNNVGTSGWATTPAAGTIIYGVTSGAIGIKHPVQSNAALALDMYWVSGTFIAGEQVTDGVTTSTNSIGGGGVTYANNTNVFLLFGINRPCVTYGVQPEWCVTGFDIGARLTVRNSCGSYAGSNHMETVTYAAILWTNTSTAVPTTGKQIILDTNNNLVAKDGVAASSGAGGGLVGAIQCLGTFNNTPAFTGSKRFNASAVAYLGTGQYRVSFTTPLADTDYQVFVQRSNVASNLIVALKHTDYFYVYNYNSSSVATDLTGTCDFLVMRTG